MVGIGFGLIQGQGMYSYTAGAFTFNFLATHTFCGPNIIGKLLFLFTQPTTGTQLIQGIKLCWRHHMATGTNCTIGIKTNKVI
jgi:hypothetical protein